MLCDLGHVFGSALSLELGPLEHVDHHIGLHVGRDIQLWPLALGIDGDAESQSADDNSEAVCEKSHAHRYRETLTEGSPHFSATIVRRMPMAALKVMLAMLLFGAMLTAFAGLMVVGFWALANGPIWLGVLCLLLVASWSYFANERRQKGNLEHFKDYGV